MQGQVFVHEWEMNFNFMHDLNWFKHILFLVQTD